MGAKYCDQRVCMSVCLFPLFICLPACISRKPHVQISASFCTCYLWPWIGHLLMTATRYVMYFRFCGWTSCFIIMQEIGRNQRRRAYFVEFTRWRHQCRSVLSSTGSCCQCRDDECEREICSPTNHPEF